MKALTHPFFWIGLMITILLGLQMISPKPKPLTEAEQQQHNEMMAHSFAL